MGILDPSSYMQITESMNYRNNTGGGAHDISLIKEGTLLQV